jgi:HK97 family phage major capsid protein
MELKDLITKIDAEIKKMEDIIAAGLEKQEKGLQGTAETISQVKDTMTKAEEKLLALEDEKKALETRLSDLEVKIQRPGFGAPDEMILATPGQQFILSEQFQTAFDKKAKIVEAVEMKSLFESKQIPGATRGDLPPDRAPVWPTREQEYIFEPGQRQMRLFDLMATSPTSSNSIEYFREVLDDSYDGPGSQEDETHEKNQMSMNFEKETCIVETIAAWLPASRQVLADAPQLQAHIDGRLRYFVMAEAERQLLYGTGAGGQILGIINTPGIQTIGAPTGTQTTLDILRLAAALVRVQEYQPTAVVLHPNDWAAIELLKGNDLHYIWVQVPTGGEMRVWRVPVVETTVIQEGQFLMGAFGLGAKFWDRQQASVRVSEHHDDFFIRNAVAILAEIRLALCVYRPSAFVLGTISTPAS